MGKNNKSQEQLEVQRYLSDFPVCRRFDPASAITPGRVSIGSFGIPFGERGTPLTMPVYVCDTENAP
jgi:hypothetical protein